MKFSDNLNRLKALLDTEKYTLVIADEDKIKTSSQHGIKPLMDFYLDDNDYTGFSAADRVIGKAAAFLYVLMEIKEIYALVVSAQALEVLKKYRINIIYEKCVPAIANRTKTGFCPMETAVADIDNPQEAIAAIKNKLAELSG